MNDKESSKNTKRHNRSRAYPVFSLADALVRIEKINTNLGLNGQFNRESLAVGMGYKSLNGASARAVAALVHYGLLEREKDQYSLSALARKYLLPMTDDDQALAKHEAALSPCLFSEIYEGFKGQIIPKQFKNRLIHEYGVQQNAADSVEQVFQETMQTAGLLQPNGILARDLPASQSQPAQNEEPATESTQGQTPVANATHTLDNATSISSSNMLSVNLPSGLVVSYSQELAPAFAFGQFGIKLKELNDDVQTYLDGQKESSNEEAA